MFKHLSITLLLLTTSLPTWSYTECERYVDKVWNNMTSSQTVWVTFTDGGSSIYKAESQMTTGQMSRFYAMALTAKITRSPLQVRYPDDTTSCPPQGNDRGDVSGIWLK